jgi:hypothetical protein
MSNAHHEEAKRRLAELLAVLRAQPDAAALDEAIQMGDQLERAIGAFHMEAIRFRMFTMGRLLARADPAVPMDVLERFAAVRTALEAAGFHTRSVAH